MNIRFRHFMTILSNERDKMRRIEAVAKRHPYEFHFQEAAKIQRQVIQNLLDRPLR